MRKVEVVNHNPKWREKFHIEAEKINPNSIKVDSNPKLVVKIFITVNINGKS